jgi:predicted CoA-binding protein
MKTLVIGASEKPERYSFKAIKLLTKNNHEVIALGNKKGFIDQTEIITERKNHENIHTVTLYIGPKIQPEYYDYIISLKPKRIIFNPGTENEEFIKIAKENNIQTIEDCTLVMLNSETF